MNNVILLLQERQRHLSDTNFFHTLRSNQTLAFEVSQFTSIKCKTKYSTTSLDVDSQGEYLLSGDAVGAISIHQINLTVPYSTNNLACICFEPKTGHKFSINSIKWFPNDSGIFITGSSDKSIKVWDTNEMVAVESFSFPGHVYDLGMTVRKSKTSQLIAAALSSHNVQLCDIRTGSDTHVLRGHTAAVNCIEWSHRNSNALMSAGRDGKIIMWDIRRAKSVVHYFDKNNSTSDSAHSGAVTSLSQTEGGLYLVSSGQDQQVRCWDVTSGENTMRNFGTAPAVADVKHITSTISYNSCYPGLLFLPVGSNVSVFDILTGQPVKELSGHFGRVNGVCYNSVQPQLFSCSSDCTVLVWEPPGPEDMAEERDKEQDKVYQDTWSDSDEG